MHCPRFPRSHGLRALPGNAHLEALPVLGTGLLVIRY